MPDTYYTPVTGMVGTGTPAAPAGATPTSQTAPDSVTGGTYSGMEVDSRVRQAIEAGSGAGHFYFEEIPGRPGYFSMHPKLPEYGAASPQSPVFKLRENSNWLAKGLAMHFLNEQGEVDYQKGLDFLAQVEAAFVTDVPSRASASYTETLERNLGWLASSLQIPASQRSDFQEYMKAFYLDTDPGKTSHHNRFMNLLNVWKGWGFNGLNLENKIKSLYPRLNRNMALTALRLEYRELADDSQNAVGELKSMAHMDPASQMQAIAVTDCNYNMTMGRLQFQAAQNARRQLVTPGPGAGPSRPEASPAAEPDAGPQGFRTTFTGEHLWSDHTAPVLGSFDLDGHTYYLTAESFAPETYSFMKHPGMTSQLSIGVYRDKDDFAQYYSHIDHSLNPTRTETRNWRKEMRGNTYGYDDLVNHYTQIRPSVPESYLEEAAALHRKVMTEAHTGPAWEDEYHRQQLSHSSEYQATMGTDTGQVNHHLEKECRLALRTGMAMTSRIPKDYQPLWTALMDAGSRLIEANSAVDNEMSIYTNVLEKHYPDPDDPTAREIRSYLDTLSSQSETIRPARERLLNALVLNIGRPGLDWSQAFAPPFDRIINQQLEGTGFTCDQVIRMASAIDGHLQPATEVTMLLQAADPTFAGEFLGQPDPSCLSDRAREFAVQNFDQAFLAAFSQEELDGLLADGRDLMDQIYVNGQSIRELYGSEVASMPAFQASQTLKCRAMSHILHGDPVRVVPPAWDGYTPLLQVNLSADIPALSAFFLTSREHSGDLTAASMDQITASQEALARRSPLEKRRFLLHQEDIRPVYPDLGSVDNGPISSVLPKAPLNYQGDYARQVYRLYQESGNLEPSGGIPAGRREDLQQLAELGQTVFTRIAQSAGIYDSTLRHPVYGHMGIRHPDELFFIDGMPAIDYLAENRGYSRETLSQNRKLLQAELAAHITSGEHAIDIATVGMDERGNFQVGVQALHMDLKDLNGQEHFYQRSRNTRARALAAGDTGKGASSRQEAIRQGFSDRVVRGVSAHLAHREEPQIRAYERSAALLANGTRGPQVYQSFFDPESRQSLEQSTRGFSELTRNNHRGMILMAQMALMAEHPEIRYADLMNPHAFVREKQEMGQRVAEAMELFTGNPSDPRPLAAIRDNCMKALGAMDVRKELLYFLGQPDSLSPEETEALLNDPARQGEYHSFMGSIATFAQSSFQLISQTGSRMPAGISSSLTPAESTGYRRAVNGMVSFYPSVLFSDLNTGKPVSVPSPDKLAGYETITRIQRSMLAREGQTGKWPFNQSSLLRQLSNTVRDASPEAAAALATGSGFLEETARQLEGILEDGGKKLFSAVPEFDFSGLERSCGIRTLNREASRQSVAYGFMLGEPDLSMEDLASHPDPDFLKERGADFVSFALEHPVNGPDVTPAQRTDSLDAYARMYGAWGDKMTREPFPDIDFSDPASLAGYLGRMSMMRNLSIDFSQSEEYFRRDPEYVDKSGGLDQVDRRARKMMVIQELSSAFLEASGISQNGLNNGKEARAAARAAGTFLLEQYGPLIRGKTPDELAESLDLETLQLRSQIASAFFATHPDVTRQYLDGQVSLSDLSQQLTPDPAMVQGVRQATADQLETRRTALEAAGQERAGSQAGPEAGTPEAQEPHAPQANEHQVREPHAPDGPEHPAPQAPGRRKLEGGFGALTQMEPAPRPPRPDRRHSQLQTQKTAQKAPKEPGLHG